MHKEQLADYMAAVDRMKDSGLYDGVLEQRCWEIEHTVSAGDAATLRNLRDDVLSGNYEGAYHRLAMLVKYYI